MLRSLFYKHSVFAAGQSEKITEPLEYFTALERHHETDEHSVLIYLEKVFREINRNDVAQKVNYFITNQNATSAVDRTDGML